MRIAKAEEIVTEVVVRVFQLLRIEDRKSTLTREKGGRVVVEQEARVEIEILDLAREAVKGVVEVKMLQNATAGVGAFECCTSTSF